MEGDGEEQHSDEREMSGRALRAIGDKSVRGMRNMKESNVVGE